MDWRVNFEFRWYNVGTYFAQRGFFFQSAMAFSGFVN